MLPNSPTKNSVSANDEYAHYMQLFANNKDEFYKALGFSDDEIVELEALGSDTPALTDLSLAEPTEGEPDHE